MSIADDDKGAFKPHSNDLLYSGEVVGTGRRKDVLRNTINHLVHHRAQLTVYLRMNEVPLPQLYGPTADER
jgi:uncharacterized damage-inducible protein DinB